VVVVVIQWTGISTLQLIYRGWLNLESLLRDNRSHAPSEVRNKCLDLSRIYIADEVTGDSEEK
jgi:hypothetical protein